MAIPVSLFKVFGFEVKLDISWLLLAALITWSLASGLFPEYYKDLPHSAYWWMGVAGAVGLFLSIIVHELTHSLVARHYRNVHERNNSFYFRRCRSDGR